MGLFDRVKQAFDAANSEEGPQSVGEQTQEEKDIVAHVKQKVEESRSSANRIAHEGIWMTNIAYLLGYDGIAFNSTLRQFQPINRATAYLKKNRIHVNKILPAVQNRLARLCKNPPAYDIMPESNSTDDKEAARLSLQILTSMWRKLTIDKKRIFLYMWVQQCGHAWMKVSWDPTLGKQMPEFDDEDSDGGILDPSQMEAMKEQAQFGYEGDVRIDVFSPFEVFPDPMARCDDDVLESWLITAKVRKLDYFKSQYPKKGKLVREEDAWLLSAQYEQRINSLNTRGPSSSGLQETMRNSAIEMVKYEARSSKYPNGRMIICANGVLLDDKELPVGEIPFRKFDDTIIGGKFFSETPVTHARPIQDQYNETIRRRAEWTRKLLSGKFKAARGSGLAAESMNDESGEIVYFDAVPGSPGGPEPIQIPMIPQWAYTEENQLNLMMNEIFGLSDVSKGILPSASIPAIGMQLLTEQDDTRIGVITEQHEHAWAGVGSLILKYIEKFYMLPRKLKVAGPDMAYTVRDVVGSDIRGNTDVFVIRGSTVPGSKTLDRQDIFNVFNMGLLGDKADPAVLTKVLDMLEFGEISGVWEDTSLDNSQIKRGIEKLEAGIPVEMSEFDNHPAWLIKLNRVRKSDKWDSYPPMTQQLFLQTMEQSIGTLVGQGLSMSPPPMAPPMTGPSPSPKPMPPRGGTPPAQPQVNPAARAALGGS